MDCRQVFDQQIDVLEEERSMRFQSFVFTRKYVFRSVQSQVLRAESGLKFTRLVWSQEFLFCTFALTPIGQHPNPSDIHHYSHVFRSLSLLTQLADHRFFFEQMWLGSFVVFFRLFNTIVQVRMIPALRSCIS
jgi:hypothetical protein